MESGMLQEDNAAAKNESRSEQSRSFWRTVRRFCLINLSSHVSINIFDAHFEILH